MKPNVNHLWVFESIAYVYVHGQLRFNLDYQNMSHIFIWYDSNSKVTDYIIQAMDKLWLIEMLSLMNNQLGIGKLKKEKHMIFFFSYFEEVQETKLAPP